MEASWGRLKASWGPLGGPRASLEAILDSFGRILVATRGSLGVFLQFLNVISEDVILHLFFIYPGQAECAKRLNNTYTA